jgi:hypothetical protein
MAGEVMVTDSAFAKTGSSGFGETLITTAYRYGRGQSAYANGYGRSNFWVNDAFNLYLYYKISNSASWVQSGPTLSWSSNSNYWQTLHCDAAHRHYIRWRARWYADEGDNKAYVRGTLYVRSAQVNGVGTGRYVRNCSNFGCGTSDVAPTWNTTTAMTTAHNILATDNKDDYT